MLVIKLFRCLIGVVSLTPLMASASCWEEAGASYGIEPALLKAIAWKESRGHPNAIGPVDPKTGHRAYGLMRISAMVINRFGERDQSGRWCCAVNGL